MKTKKPFSFLMLFAQISSAMCEIIENYNENGQTTINEAYHLAQVSPPGFYQILIWSNLKSKICEENVLFFDIRRMGKKGGTTADGKHKEENMEKYLYFRWHKLIFRSVEQLAKCFGHFSNVLTDENGQFLMKKEGIIKNEKMATKLAHGNGNNWRNYNVHIIPLSREMPILDPFAHFVVQKMHSLAKNVPFDSLCDFKNNGQKRCFLNYFETFADKQKAVDEIFSRWFNAFTPLLLEKEIFFLNAFLKELIGELKNERKIDGQFVQLFDIFGKYFRAENNSLLDIAKLRLVDEQMIGLISELCQINEQSQNLSKNLFEQFKSFDLQLFCEKWAPIHQKMLHFSEPEIALNSFRHWLNPPNGNGDKLSTDKLATDKVSTDKLSEDKVSNWDGMSDEMRQIVKFWMTVLSSKMNYHCNKWTKNDIFMLREIGELLKNKVNSADKKVISLMDAVQSESEFENICEKFDNFWESCRDEYRQLPIQWPKICYQTKSAENSSNDGITPFDELLKAAPELTITHLPPKITQNNILPKKAAKGMPKSKSTREMPKAFDKELPNFGKLDKQMPKLENDLLISGKKLPKSKSTREMSKLPRQLSNSGKYLSKLGKECSNSGELLNSEDLPKSMKELLNFDNEISNLDKESHLDKECSSSENEFPKSVKELFYSDKKLQILNNELPKLPSEFLKVKNNSFSKSTKKFIKSAVGFKELSKFKKELPSKDCCHTTKEEMSQFANCSHNAIRNNQKCSRSSSRPPPQ